MARAALGWGVRDLARAAKVSSDTVSRLERSEPLKDRTSEAIQRALEAAGIEFLPDDGVRLRAASKPPIRGPKPEPSSGSGGGNEGNEGPPEPERQAKPVPPLSKSLQLRALREARAASMNPIRLVGIDV